MITRVPDIMLPDKPLNTLVQGLMEHMSVGELGDLNRLLVKARKAETVTG